MLILLIIIVVLVIMFLSTDTENRRKNSFENPKIIGSNLIVGEKVKLKNGSTYQLIERDSNGIFTGVGQGERVRLFLKSETFVLVNGSYVQEDIIEGHNIPSNNRNDSPAKREKPFKVKEHKRRNYFKISKMNNFDLVLGYFVKMKNGSMYQLVKRAPNGVFTGLHIQEGKKVSLLFTNETFVIIDGVYVHEDNIESPNIYTNSTNKDFAKREKNLKVEEVGKDFGVNLESKSG